MAKDSLDLKNIPHKIILKHSTIDKESQPDVLELVTIAIDRCFNLGNADLENASRYLKEAMDKSYGVHWQCIIGKGFSFDITGNQGSILNCFYHGDLGVLLFKT